MRVSLHENRVEAALEQMSVLPMSPIEPLCIRTVEPVESGGERRAWRFHDEVEVVRHQAKRMSDPAEPARYLIEEREKAETIAIVGEDLLTSIPPRCDVVDAAGE
jgi:hypothetical protein